jgi:hypothetical protein
VNPAAQHNVQASALPQSTPSLREFGSARSSHPIDMGAIGIRHLCCCPTAYGGGLAKQAIIPRCEPSQPPDQSLRQQRGGVAGPTRPCSTPATLVSRARGSGRIPNSLPHSIRLSRNGNQCCISWSIDRHRLGPRVRSLQPHQGEPCPLRRRGQFWPRRRRRHEWPLPVTGPLQPPERLLNTVARRGA